VLVLGVGLAILAAVELAVSWNLAVDHDVDPRLEGLAAFLTLLVVLGQPAGWLVARAGRSGVGLAVQAAALVAPLNLLRTYEPIFYLAWLGSIALPAVAVLAVLPAGSERRATRRLVVIAVLLPIAALIALVVAVVTGPHWSSWLGLIYVFPGRGAQAVHLVAVLALVVLAIGAADMVMRFFGGTRTARRRWRPIVLPGLVWSGATAGLLVKALRTDATFAFGTTVLVLSIIQLLALATLIGGITWIVALLPRLQQYEQDEPAAIRTAKGLVRYLRRALGDPSAILLFADDHGRWFDVDGAATAPAFADRERAVVVLERSGVPLGAIECDSSLASEPETIELVATATALSMDATRQVAIAEAEAERARLLASRLVDTAQVVRRQLRDELTTGPIADLAAVEQHIVDGGDPESIVAALRATSERVREIAHGLIPPTLESGGLAGALHTIKAVPTRRYPSAVEITAFAAARDDADATIVDDGQALTITLSHEPRDPVLRDRVSVLGGVVDRTCIVLPLQD
jgi:hypothetical protein